MPYYNTSYSIFATVTDAFLCLQWWRRSEPTCLLHLVLYILYYNTSYSVFETVVEASRQVQCWRRSELTFPLVARRAVRIVRIKRAACDCRGARIQRAADTCIAVPALQHVVLAKVGVGAPQPLQQRQGLRCNARLSAVEELAVARDAETVAVHICVGLAAVPALSTGVNSGQG